MEIAVKFSNEELKLLSLALDFGIVNTEREEQEEEFLKLQRKITYLGGATICEEANQIS